MRRNIGSLANGLLTRTRCWLCTLTTAGITRCSIGASDGSGWPPTAAGSAAIAGTAAAGAGAACAGVSSGIVDRGRGEAAERGGGGQGEQGFAELGEGAWVDGIRSELVATMEREVDAAPRRIKPLTAAGRDSDRRLTRPEFAQRANTVSRPARRSPGRPPAMRALPLGPSDLARSRVEPCATGRMARAKFHCTPPLTVRRGRA